jgi:hypothetical protein
LQLHVADSPLKKRKNTLADGSLGAHLGMRSARTGGRIATEAVASGTV